MNWQMAAHDEHHLAPDPVAHIAPHGSRDELADGEGREENADDDDRRTEVLHVIRHQRQENTEAEDIDERDAENGEQSNDHAVIFSSA